VEKNKKAASTYSEAGVDTEAEEKGLKSLIGYIRKTFTFNEFSVMLDFGYFANILNIGNNMGLAVSTDGVGTKILVAQMMGKYDTVGIDCIAMNVNDILCVGAIPFSMVDYIALQSPEPDLLDEIGKGLLKGAEIAQISIPGGEIAQVREMIKGERDNFGFDLVGTAVGLVSLDRIIVGQNIKEGDTVVGLRSSGIHSNGFTLARKVLFEKGMLSVDSFVPELDKTIGEELLTPTKIYVPEVKEMLSSGLNIKALVHITGDGLLNLLRVKTDCGFIIDSLPEPQPIFKLIEKIGSVQKDEMFKVFNMGIGFCIIINPGDVEKVFSICRKYNTECYRIGYVHGSERKIIIEKEGLIGRDNKFFKLY